jgi:hypothetical protein
MTRVPGTPRWHGHDHDSHTFLSLQNTLGRAWLLLLLVLFLQALEGGGAKSTSISRS